MEYRELFNEAVKLHKEGLISDYLSVTAITGIFAISQAAKESSTPDMMRLIADMQDYINQVEEKCNE